MNIDDLFKNQELIDMAEEHHIAGYLYSRHECKEFRKIWIKQALVKKLLYEEIEKVSKAYPEVTRNLALLKGMAIHDQFYTDGERFMSDVDILVIDQSIEDVIKIFIELGFKIVNEKKWLGDSFKCELSKKTLGIDMNIELHTKLFYHTEVPLEYMDSSIGNFKKLSPEYELAHIVGHCGFQHTFQKLYWLLDSYHYFKEGKIDLGKLDDICRKMKIFNSLEMTKTILNSYFSLKIKGKNKFSKIDLKLLINPNQGSFKYYILKHKMKDSFYESIRYDFEWLKMQVKKILRNNSQKNKSEI